MSLKREVGMLAAAAILVSPSAAATGNGRIVYSDGGNLYVVDSGGGAPVPLRAGFNPAFSPDGTRLAFEQWTGDGFEVDVATVDGSNPVKITTVPAVARLVWSPDGTRIAFASGTYASGYALTVASADGSGSTIASQDASGNAAPTWSPDGTELAFATANDVDIAVVKATGGGRKLLIQDSTSDTAPSWSPDGSQIAFFRGEYGNYHLYSIGPDGSGLHQLGQVSAGTGSPPAWSTDGSHLVFGGNEVVGYSRYGPQYRENVYSVAADGAGERRLTDSWSYQAGSNPGWSPDGQRILFTTRRLRTGGGSQLFAMNPDGSCETQLASNSFDISSASWQALADAASAEPIRCAALSLTGTLTASTDHPALDDYRIYVYRGTITNSGNVTSDSVRFTTESESGPFTYVSATVSGGDCIAKADVSCSLPPLAPGGSATVELRFMAFVSGGFPLEASVAGNGTTLDGDLSDNVDYQYRRFPFCEISTQNGSAIRALGDDDLICGTVGRDRIFAGAGDDRVFAGLGHDVVRGGPGADEVDGGGGTDYVYGEGDEDKLHGGFGDDVLIGGGGNDILWGDEGGDYLKGGPGVDRFFGGYGNDLIDSRDGLTEHIYCGYGNDRVLADMRDIIGSDCEKIVRRPATPTRH